MANKRIQVSELDFDGIKANLKNFLRGQSTFSDYDFEGSNLSVLIDLLAYNTHYNAMYTNFALNEAFIDSASKRDSVVSIARGLGYTPRSSICASAKFNLKLTGTSSTPATITLPKNTAFFGNKDGIRYYFYNADDITATLDTLDNSYTWNNVTVYEGKNLKNTFNYSATNKYIIPNVGIDTNTLNVSVVKSDNTVFSFKQASTLTNITGNSDVYFLHEVDGGFYRMTFGDGIMGSQLDSGDRIVIDYMVCNGSAPNNITTLAYGGGSVLGSSAFTVTMVSSVLGGKYQETIDEIKFNAPSLYVTQDRAVTVEDFKTILKAKVPYIGDAIVWGGENNDPPVYGKVFVSAVNPDGNPLTEDEIYNMDATIARYKIATVIMEFVDAEFLDINLGITAYYDETQTHKTPDELRSAIYDNFVSYNTNSMRKFDSVIRNSMLIRTAELADASIVNVIPKMTINYNMNVIFNTKTNYTVKIKNPIYDKGKTVFSSGFYCGESSEGLPCYIDNGRKVGSTVISSELWLFELLSNGKRRDIRKVGTINFDQGTFTINSLSISSIVGTNLTITFTPASRDVVGFNNKVLRLDMTKLSVDVIADSNINGQINNSYNFVKN